MFGLVFRLLSARDWLPLLVLWLPANTNPGRLSWWLHQLGTCQACGRSGLSFYLQALTQASHGHCRYLENKSQDWEIALCFSSVFLSTYSIHFFFKKKKGMIKKLPVLKEERFSLLNYLFAAILHFLHKAIVIILVTQRIPSADYQMPILFGLYTYIMLSFSASKLYSRSYFCHL